MWALIGIVAGGGAAIALVAWFGLAAVWHEVLRAGWVLPATTALMFAQLCIAALAWRIAAGAPRPGLGRYMLIRWIRELVNTLLPVAQLGGVILGAHMLTRRGLPAARATAATTLDVVIEAVTQAIFVLAGFAALASIDWRAANAPWVYWVLGAMALVVGGLLLALRGGAMHLVERLAGTLGRFFPRLSLDGLRGLHQEMMRLHRDRVSLLKASFWHLLAYFMGVGETWILLKALGQPASLPAALVIESLGLAARSVGFAVPSGLGVQEAGFLLVGRLFGVPPEAAIALSMLKRAREICVGVPGLVVWQWIEGRRHLRRVRAR